MLTFSAGEGVLRDKKKYVVDVDDFRIFRLISFINTCIKILHFCNEQIMTKIMNLYYYDNLNILKHFLNLVKLVTKYPLEERNTYLFTPMSSSLYVLIHYFIVETFEKNNLNQGADMISISLELVNVWELLLSGSFTKILTIDFDLINKRKRTIQLLFTKLTFLQEYLRVKSVVTVPQF